MIRDLHDKVLDVQCGPQHTLATAISGKIYSWGEASRGQLGLGYSEALQRCRNQFEPKPIQRSFTNESGQIHLVKQVGCGKNISLILEPNGAANVCGKGMYQRVKFDDYKEYSVPRLISEDIKVRSLAAGYDHYLMVDKHGMLWVTGENAHGCLGVADGKKRVAPFQNQYFDNLRIIDIACGDKFSIVIAEVYELTPEAA